VVPLDAGTDVVPAPRWLGAPQLMRFESLYIRVAPSLAFDALVYVDTASPGIVRER
jgi:hypothetical protein